MKKIIFFLLIHAAVNVAAHEFWIQPDKFIYKRGETVNLRFLVGENYTGDNWSGNRDKVQNLQLYFENVTDKDLGNQLDTVKGDSLQLAMLDEGTVMVTLNTKNSFIELEGNKFNDYLREDGLTEALEYRIQNNDTLKAGREYYQRSVKTIFQVGSKTTNSCKQKTDLPIDIVPDDNPYSMSRDEDFKVAVFFMGEKLRNTKIKVWHRYEDKLTQHDYMTDDDGKLKFFYTPQGEWMVSCVKMVRLPSDTTAEWQSYWGSLTWGYTK